MPKKPWSLLLLSLLASCASVDQAAPLEDLNWLLGEWRAEQGPELVIESWREGTPHTFEGLSSTRSKAKKVVMSEESMRIVHMSGEVFFLAKVPGNELPVAFKMVSQSERRAVFENLKHDFPNRLIYHRLSMNTLKVDVQGKDGKGFSLRFRR